MIYEVGFGSNFAGELEFAFDFVVDVVAEVVAVGEKTVCLFPHALIFLFFEECLALADALIDIFELSVIVDAALEFEMVSEFVKLSFELLVLAEGAAETGWGLGVTLHFSLIKL